jgi:6-phosphogluconolactonase
MKLSLLGFMVVALASACARTQGSGTQGSGAIPPPSSASATGHASQSATATATASATASPPPAAGAPAATGPLVYVGGYRPEILIFRLDVQAAQLVPVGSADGGSSPSFLAFDPRARFLYAVNEVDDGRVVSFAIDRASGALTRLNDASSAGFGPAHLSVDRTGRWVLVGNYAGSKPGTIAVLPVGSDGRLGAAVARHDFGPGTMPHHIAADPSNQFVFVPCKGGPYVAQHRFDAATGQLAPGTPDRIKSPPGSGPRHLAFHPNGRFAFVINEQAMTITSYKLDPANGLTEIASVPTVPAEITNRKGFSTAEIEVHPSGRWLYGSNRGHNSIVQFAVDQTSGRLTLVGHEQRGIEKPRHFSLDPSGQMLMSANESGASVSIFRIDSGTGRLQPTGAPIPAGNKPSFVAVLPTPAP